MRKHQQRQILELLQTIKEVQSAGLYADCQDGAISIGGFIENVEGEGTQTVALLEDYCELLFKASEGDISEKYLRKHLIKIENSIKSELEPNKIEIAFLSYNASMSDSIESIYLAAKNDPDCDAYWIPIPFYECNADGSFGAMRYEGANCYGDHIECADWREYDIEARHPDVIFTFNPYDGGNYVTSVHPNFYCERLRDLTDMLVYIPYFVCGYVIPEAFPHFIKTAGSVYAHRIFVQSNRICDIYTQIFNQEFGRTFGRGNEKFIALGSPKFDKTLSIKREDNPLTHRWSKLVENKKVVFYNTSIGAMLEGNEQYLRKLHLVLDVFRKRDDVALWWRPHPLSSATFGRMRPHLLNEYKAIVERYRQEGWGVYDDTPDLHRAIVWSEAYYGDISSIVPLFAINHKPILIKALEYTPRTVMVSRSYAVGECGESDLDEWLNDFSFIPTTRKFTDVDNYQYTDGTSGKSIYLYCKNLALN